MPPFINELISSLSVNSDESLEILLTRTPYGYEKNYPVAIVHESTRIKERLDLAYFNENALLDDKGLTYSQYPRDTLDKIARNTPNYIQNVGYMFATQKEIPLPTFTNKFKHDYWKKIQSVKGLEAVVDISTLSPTTTACEAEDALRAIIRKRKEVHQLKKITFVWIVEIADQNTQIDTVMKHYFIDNVTTIRNGKSTYYLGWSIPLQDINMRYFVCPPE